MDQCWKIGHVFTTDYVSTFYNPDTKEYTEVRRELCIRCGEPYRGFSSSLDEFIPWRR